MDENASLIQGIVADKGSRGLGGLHYSHLHRNSINSPTFVPFKEMVIFYSFIVSLLVITIVPIHHVHL